MPGFAMRVFQCILDHVVILMEIISVAKLFLLNPTVPHMNFFLLSHFLFY